MGAVRDLKPPKSLKEASNKPDTQFVLRHTFPPHPNPAAIVGITIAGATVKPLVYM